MKILGPVFNRVSFLAFFLSVSSVYASDSYKDALKEGRKIARESNVKKNSQFQSLTHFARSVSAWDLFWTQGVVPRPWRNKNRLNTDLFSRRKIKSRNEMFAHHYAHYKTDPEYPCRYPANSLFISRLLKDSGYDKKLIACGGVETRVIQQDSDRKIYEMPGILDLDPNRVLRVEYLYASEGEAMMSRWGHAMIKIIACADFRDKVSQECEKDTAFHSVISFRASIDDMIQNQVKGITGGYPSQLFILPFWSVVKEYNQQELRDLEVFRFNFTEEEKRIFLYAVLERYWAYQGRYAFFTNNCSQETAQLLKTAFEPSRLEEFEKGLNGFTPRLLKRKLTKGEFVENVQKKSGSYFPSGKNALSKSFNVLVEEYESLQQYGSIDEFISKTKSASDRRKIFDEIILEAKKNKISQLAALFYTIESRAIILNEKETRELIQTKYRDFKSENKSAVDSFIIKFRMEKPWELFAKGFGVPLRKEFDLGIHEIKNAIVSRVHEIEKLNLENSKSDQNVDLKHKLPEGFEFFMKMKSEVELLKSKRKDIDDQMQGYRRIMKDYLSISGLN